jgi:hypothetical protein
MSSSARSGVCASLQMAPPAARSRFAASITAALIAA